MSYTIKNHLLYLDGTQVPFKKTPNVGGKMSISNMKYLVMHFTGSNSNSSAVNWLTNSQAQASAHLVIDHDGSITQLAPFNNVCWHAGKSSWKGLSGLNSYSVGIELVNAGMLGQNGNGKFFERLGNKPVSNEDVSVVRGTPWMKYDIRQIDVAKEVGKVIFETYDMEDVLGHEEIAPGRKTDPGPAFPMSSFEGYVVGRQ
jgi:N-acetylmuramoyl-L-alanine amidase